MEKIRLDKFLSSQLNISRTDAKKMLKNGNVSLNGEAIKRADIIIDADKDKVSADGKEIQYKKYVYIMLYKPAGVVSASSSPGDITVIDILPEEYRRSGLFPAGRLDKDTTGFVLITDDGEFAHNILSPAHHVSKTYTVTLERDVTDDEVRCFENGLMIGEELFKPALLKKLRNDERGYVYSITITEGRYHQIKRMFGSVGNKVLALHRDSIGNLELDSTLAPGKSRYLTPQELELINN